MRKRYVPITLQEDYPQELPYKDVVAEVGNRLLSQAEEDQDNGVINEFLQELNDAPAKLTDWDKDFDSLSETLTSLISEFYYGEDIDETSDDDLSDNNFLAYANNFLSQLRNGLPQFLGDHQRDF